MKEAEELPGAPVLNWRNNQRLAKKRMRAIVYTRGADKKARLYRDLIKATRNTLDYIDQADLSLQCTGVDLRKEYAAWRVQVKHTMSLI